MGEKGRDKLPFTHLGGYEILGEIGHGGMGAVYKARSANGVIVALKLLNPSLTKNQVQLTRFYREAEIARRLDHPNVVRALDIGNEKGFHYFVMEYVDGESVRNLSDRVGKIPEADAVRIIVDVAQAVHRAHSEGLVHRDIKPDNVLLTKNGHVKLADMGLVKKQDCEIDLTITGKGLGTPYFMAPEQFRDAKNADARMDIYSMGASLYMMVTGELPFKGLSPLDAWTKKAKDDFPPPESLAPELSPRVASTIKRSMAGDPSKRPATAREFIAALLGNDAELPPDPEEAYWYVMYQDAQGKTQRFKAKYAVIARQIRTGKIGPFAQAATSRAGPFVSLSKIDAFHSCFAEAATGSAGKEFKGEPPPAAPTVHGETQPAPFAPTVSGAPSSADAATTVKSASPLPPMGIPSRREPTPSKPVSVYVPGGSGIRYIEPGSSASRRSLPDASALPSRDDSAASRSRSQRGPKRWQDNSSKPKNGFNVPGGFWGIAFAVSAIAAIAVLAIAILKQ